MNSFAKLNLGLKILGKRPDGYHELETIFQEISLCDEIDVRLSQSGINMTCEGLAVPCDESNLMVMAARKILLFSGKKTGVVLKLKKIIPIGAGLGGGSSNAATVLKEMNKLLGLGYSSSKLKKIALELGADIPFFIDGGASLGKGIGEKLSPVSIPPFWAVLIYPGINISTHSVYSNMKMVLTSREDSIRITLDCANRDDLHGMASALVNDMESYVLPQYSDVAAFKAVLLDEGALASLMSGSGSSVFGIFPSYAKANIALERIGEGLCEGVRAFLVSSVKEEGFEEYK